MRSARRYHGRKSRYFGRLNGFGAGTLAQAIANANTPEDPFIAALITALGSALGPQPGTTLPAFITDVTPTGAKPGDAHDPFVLPPAPPSGPPGGMQPPSGGTPGELQYWILAVNGGNTPLTGSNAQNGGLGGGFIYVSKFDNASDASTGFTVAQALMVQANPQLAALQNVLGVYQVGNYVVWDDLYEGATALTSFGSNFSVPDLSFTSGPQPSITDTYNDARTNLIQSVLNQSQDAIPSSVPAGVQKQIAEGRTLTGAHVYFPPGGPPASASPSSPMTPAQAVASASQALATAAATPTDYTPWIIGGVGLLAAGAFVWAMMQKPAKEAA
jgi:hypothetical protein